ncbi:MAG TPA: hypothetical protein PKL31_02420 [Fulvivirga sp.]|nr:hypothetical protein [Fulvivirga sp.]
MKLLLVILSISIYSSSATSQTSFDYYKNPDKVGSSNELAFDYFKKAYYDHIFTWTKKGADSALHFLNKAIELDPEYGAAYTLLGHIHQFLTYGNGSKSRLEDQEKYALLAKKYAPELGDTYTLLADVLWEKGQRDSSILLLKKAVNIEPDHAGNHIWLGIRYGSEGKTREAQQEFNYILNHIDSAYGQAYMKMGALFEDKLKDLDSAALYYRMAESLYHNMSIKDARMLVAKLSLANIHQKKENIAEAIRYYHDFEKSVIGKDLFFDYLLKQTYLSLIELDSVNSEKYQSKYINFVEDQLLNGETEKVQFIWDYLNLGNKQLINLKVWPILPDLLNPLSENRPLTEEDFIGALFMTYQTSKVSSNYEKGIDLLNNLRVLNEYKPYNYYFLAKLYSLNQNVDMALETLKQCKELGFPYFASVKEDEDFNILSKNKSFMDLTK